jgi:hypothetical protein
VFSFSFSVYIHYTISWLQVKVIFIAMSLGKSPHLSDLGKNIDYQVYNVYILSVHDLADISKMYPEMVGYRPLGIAVFFNRLCDLLIALLLDSEQVGYCVWRVSNRESTFPKNPCFPSGSYATGATTLPSSPRDRMSIPKSDPGQSPDSPKSANSKTGEISRGIRPAGARCV